MAFIECWVLKKLIVGGEVWYERSGRISGKDMAWVTVFDDLQPSAAFHQQITPCKTPLMKLGCFKAGQRCARTIMIAGSSACHPWLMETHFVTILRSAINTIGAVIRQFSLSAKRRFTGIYLISWRMNCNRLDIVNSKDGVECVICAYWWPDLSVE